MTDIYILFYFAINSADLFYRPFLLPILIFFLPTLFILCVCVWWCDGKGGEGLALGFSLRSFIASML